MAEAKRSIQESTDQAQRMAIMTLATRAARKVVERQLRSTGRRLPDVDHKEIMTLANDYLAAHPAELIAEAAETVRTNPKLRTLVERQARQLARNRS